MASFEELVRMNKEGDLSKMLAKKFNGKRGHITGIIEDMDLLIAFDSIEKTPSIEDIQQTVIEYYKGLGYIIEKNNIAGEMFDAIICSGSKRDGIMIIVITTKYPLTIGTGATNHLRLTATIC